MTTSPWRQRLEDAWRESERHVHHLFQAMSALRPLWPFTAGNYAGLTDDQVRDLDQFILRFSKLQDTVGGRFFPAILGYLEEQYEDRPMLDKLNRLEKLGYLDSAEEWQRIRDIRNKFAHDYPDDNEKNAAHLNLAFDSVTDIYDLLSAAGAKLQREHPEVKFEKSLSSNSPTWAKLSKQKNL